MPSKYGHYVFMEEYSENYKKSNSIQNFESAAKKFVSIYQFFYASSSEFFLTEYGWGIFPNKTPETRTKHCSDFNLPVSINHKGEISRVHLWKPEAKNIELSIKKPKDISNKFQTKKAIKVPVQYAQGGGSYLLFVRTPQKMLMNKSSIVNPFAEYDELENIAFF